MNSVYPQINSVYPQTMAVTVVVQDPSQELPALLYLPAEVELPMWLHLHWHFFHLKIFLLPVQ